MECSISQSSLTSIYIPGLGRESLLELLKGILFNGIVVKITLYTKSIQ